jgi:hypothetical protein
VFRYREIGEDRLCTKTLFWPFPKMETYTKGVTVFAKLLPYFPKVFCEIFSRKLQPDENWYKLSVEKNIWRYF